MTLTSAFRRPEHRAAAAAVTVSVLIVAALAAYDPSGLLAPIGGQGIPLMGTSGAYQWAPLAAGLPVLLAAMAAPIVVLTRVRRSMWAVFGIAWLAVVAAEALSVMVTGLVSAVPLMGSHLSPLLALRFTAMTSGFAAFKFVLVGLVAAVAAAIAYRAGPRPDGHGTEPLWQSLETVPPPPLVRVSTGVVLLAAVFAGFTFGGTWWRGGLLGYAFDGHLVAPTPAAGVLGYIAGMAIFVGAFHLISRWLGGCRIAVANADRAARTVVATVWIGCLAAGAVLGLTQSVIGTGPALSGAGPDDWWIGNTLLSVATGLAYGAAIGGIASILVVAAWRFRYRYRPAGPARPGTAALAGITAVAVTIFAAPAIFGSPAHPQPPKHAPVAATGAMPRLAVLPGNPPVIGDETGRQVLLRGINVNQLIDYYLRDPAVPASQPLTDADFAQMSSYGFNVVRLGMSWSRLEPRRGEFDQAYLAQIRAAVDEARSHGIYTVLDMHEDAWGDALASPGQSCPGGTSATTGFDGAPAWATITDGRLRCEFMARDLAPAVAAAFSNFYTDRDGIQTELVRTWATVAAAFAGDPAVAGYDLLNEPGIGADPPVSSGLLLGRYYSAAIAAIRAAERTGGGFSHLIFFEPSVLWSGLGFDATPPPGFTTDRELVFAPHPYSESITMDQGTGLTLVSIERNLTMASRAAANYGAALWAGEWGWFGDPAADADKVGRFVEAENRLGIGGAFWVWKQGCGHPETGDGAATSGNFIGLNCVTGAHLPPPAGYAVPLSRAYPAAVPGRLRSLTSSVTARSMAFTAAIPATEAGVNCAIDVWVPGAARPEFTSDGVGGITATGVPGGWHITGCAHGTYSVRVTA